MVEIMSYDKNAQTKLLRLGKIIRIFMEKEKVSSSWLSRYFQTTSRTIQRDLLLLKESGFALHEEKKGTYRLSRDLIKNLEVFDDTELALIVTLKNIVGQLDPSFQKAANDILDRLCDCVTTMPVFVKIDDAVPLDSTLLNRVIRAIRERKLVNFQYSTEKRTHPVTIEPYKVAYFEGFWYLIGNEPSTGILKRYALDRIREFCLSKTCFRNIPVELDNVLQGSANIWFSEKKNLEVEVLIDAKVSNYFKRRKMFPTQEIKEERPDGSIVISFGVGHYKAISDILKSWIPNIIILKPESLRTSITEDVREWLKRQDKKV